MWINRLSIIYLNFVNPVLGVVRGVREGVVRGVRGGVVRGG